MRACIRSAAPLARRAHPARRAKKSQFLTKSIITELPKVKCSVVPDGDIAASDCFAYELKASAVPSGSSHLGVPDGRSSLAGGGGGRDDVWERATCDCSRVSTLAAVAMAMASVGGRDASVSCGG